MLKSRVRTDRRLFVRMLLVVFLFSAIHLAVIVGGTLIGYVSGVIVFLVVMSCYVLQVTWGADVALRAMRAKVVDASQEPYTHEILDRLCVSAGTPKPRIAIAPQSFPTAFAVGRSRQHSTIVVTEALREVLTEEEYEAVLAHELAHIANRDAIVMSAALSFTLFAEGLAHVRDDGTGRTVDDADRPVPRMSTSWLYTPVYFVSGLIVRAISRYRDLSADRYAAHLTGNPRALASALGRLTDATQRIPEDELRQVGAADYLLFVPVPNAGALRSKFATHPTATQRLEVLAKAATDLNRPLA